MTPPDAGGPAASLHLADAALSRSSAWLDVLLAISGALATATAARIVLPLPFTPVPITGQTLAVLASGLLLGRRRGAASQAIYVAAGAIGVPWFAAGGGGALRLFGPTGGYLLGFPIAAWLVGRLAERGWDRGVARAFAAMLAGNAVIYALGLAWLSRFIPAPALLASGLLPFLAGDLLKAGLAALALSAAWRSISGREDRASRPGA